uniref:Ig-like domain-containing protein n=1 Tax=Sander lucioperca TaxID=283035 RepID=A0A8D0DF37_SANLU
TIIKPDLLSLLCLTDGSDVTQTPDILWGKKGDNATINCSHTKDAGYNQMYWYRQLPGETMKLIVFTRYGFDDHDFGDFSKDKFSATKPDTESGTFTVNNLEPEDKGLYFCAVSQHSSFTFLVLFVLAEQDRAITEPTVKVLPPSKKECQKDGAGKKTIVCVARGFYPDHVSVYWQVNLENVTDGVATDNAALREGEYYRITSRLRVSGKDWFTLNKRFTCIVNFFNGNATSSHEATVLGVKGLFFWNSEMI